MRKYFGIPFTKKAFMLEWFWWGKRLAFVHRVGGGYVANDKTLWVFRKSEPTNQFSYLDNPNWVRHHQREYIRFR